MIRRIALLTLFPSLFIFGQQLSNSETILQQREDAVSYVKIDRTRSNAEKNISPSRPTSVRAARTSNGMIPSVSAAENHQILQQIERMKELAARQTVAVNFVVTDPSDLPDSDLNDITFSPQTLRSAIQNANKTEGLDMISFAGVTTIKPLTELPVATKPIIIDGTVGGGKMILDGSLTVNKGGMWIIGSSTVKNMIFTNWGSHALALAINTGSGNNIIQGCEFYHNLGVGVNINSNNNLIGGPLPAERNIAHDNLYNPSNFRTGYGIVVLGGDDNIVTNNLFGTPDGVTPSPNQNGLGIEGLRNKVYKNVISGSEVGLYLEGDFSAFGTNGNLIENNLIGTDITGMVKMPNSTGLVFTDAIGDTIRNNIISGNFTGIGGWSGSAKGMHIHHNAIGFNISKTDTIPNRSSGMAFRGDNHLIEHNYVSGNNGYGIAFADGDSIIIRNNFVGTDTSGTRPLGNRLAGIVIELARGCIVGGNSFAEANIIGGNGGAGVQIHYSSGSIVTRGNKVRHNYIGTNAAGDTGLGNLYGVTVLRTAPKNIIESNVISRNKKHGVYIYKFVSTGDSTFVRKNFIGTDPTATHNWGNDSAGVMIEEGNGNIIGGTDLSDGNTIMFNGIDGVYIQKGTGNSVLSNIIKKNRQLSIDLENEGPLPNDPDDSDTGPNFLQNYPTITFIKVNGGNTDVKGFLKSVPLRTYKLQFFSHEKPDSTGFGEAEELRHTMDVSTDSAGIGPFSFSVSGTYRRIVATATDPNGNTSEVSKSPIIVNANGDAPDNNAVDGFADTGGPPVNGAPEVTLRAALQTAGHLKGNDYISFDIPGNLSTNFISPASALPAMDLGGVTIDGTTQSGYVVGNNTITINGSNAGAVDGLEINGSRGVIKGVDIQNFQKNGIIVAGSDAQVENVRLVSNGLNGIYASNHLHLKGKVIALNTGGGNTGSCGTGSQNAGIRAEHLLFADSVEATNNCGSGIRSDNGSIFINGSVIASNNSADGIRAQSHINILGPTVTVQTNKLFGARVFSGNIQMKATSESSPFPIRVSGNGQSGIYSQLGGVALFGKAQINNNGPEEVAKNFIGDAGLYGETFVQTDAVEIKNNRGYGIFTARGTAIIRGNAVIENNERLGILSQFNVKITGTAHSISNNKEEGIYSPNGNITIVGKISVVNNNKKNCDESPELWLPKDSEAFSSAGGAGGLSSRSLNIEDAEITGNCGAGISTGIYVHASGRLNVLNNTGNGIQTRNARITAGRICENAGYGIRLWGATNEFSAGFLDLGSVQVCGNGLGGIKGVKEKNSGSSETANFSLNSAGTPHSKISGSSITGNNGVGIEFDSHSSLTISKSNISGNTSLAVKNNDTAAVINAQNIWWGNPSGPGASVSAGVNAASHRTSPVSLTLSHSNDSTFNTAGKSDSVLLSVQNWKSPNDSVQVTVTESRGWLQSPASFIVSVKDSVPATSLIVVGIPQNSAPGDSTIISVSAQSLIDSSAADQTSFIVLAYQPVLVRVSILPDSIRILRNDSAAFQLNGFDQANKPFAVVPKWSTSGGTIDSTGLYVADSTLGTFIVTATDTVSGKFASAKVTVVNTLTGVSHDAAIPAAFVLEQNYPNPFNPSTIIRYKLPQNTLVRLKVYDLLGREIAVLADEYQRAGTYSVEWNSARKTHASGVYFYRLEAGNFVSVRKMLLLK